MGHRGILPFHVQSISFLWGTKGSFLHVQSISVLWGTEGSFLFTFSQYLSNGAQRDPSFSRSVNICPMGHRGIIPFHVQSMSVLWGTEGSFLFTSSRLTDRSCVIYILRL